MPKLKYKTIGEYEQRTKDGKTIKVLVTKPASEPVRPCKHCQKEPRLPDRTACKKCTDRRTAQKLNDAKLERRLLQAPI